MAEKIIPIKTIPFVGGVDLFHKSVALSNGGLSLDQNFRPRRPGKESRLGQIKHHTTTADSTKDIVSMYGFSKSRITENHFFAQYSDGSVDLATDNPPGATTGDFGASVLPARYNEWAASTAYSVGDIILPTTANSLKFRCNVAGTSDSSEPTWPVLGATVADNDITWQAEHGIWPASWVKFEDMMVYADGAGMAQIYTGQDMKPSLFNVYKGSVAIPTIPEEGADYTQEVIDGLSNTYADASDLENLANYHCLFAMFDTPINKMSFELSAYNSGSGAISWAAEASNPVIGLGTGWNDTNIFHPTVILDGSTYKMWVTGDAGASSYSIGLYTSPDGITWFESVGNPLINIGAATTWNDVAIDSPTVIKEGVGDYKMWLSGFDGAKRTIGFYTSSDGITWTEYVSNPVITETNDIIEPTVILDGSTYKLYANYDNAINLYTSSDGITWTPEGANPVISVGTGGEWNDANVASPSVMKEGSGDYKLWLSGNDGTDYTIGYYTSSDGVTWSEYGSNPIVSVGAGASWNDDNVWHPSVILDNNVYKMWMTGDDGSVERIGLFTYTKGVGVPTIKYWDGSELIAVSNLTDGTQSDVTLDQNGALTWDATTDEVSTYAFGRSGFLYQWSHGDPGTLDSSVHITRVTGEYTGVSNVAFQPIQNTWDGIPPEALIAVVEDTSVTKFYTYSSQAVLAGGMTTADYIYIASLDKIFGVYLDVGATPNTISAAVVDTVATWDGTAFTTIADELDGSSGGGNSGYITWPRTDTARKLNFNSTAIFAYWYRIDFTTAVSADVAWKFFTLPYFDINNIFPIVQAAAAWDNRLWYSFEDNILHGTAKNNPMALNGDDKVTIAAAKHSKNSAICMRRFYQFMLVWGEEKGGTDEGGYFSIVQPGLSASGYGVQEISETIGILNSKCAVIIEETDMSDLNRDRPTSKGAYFLSRTGFYKSDGSSLVKLSKAIENYFDPTRAESIRRGYEKEHSVAWDSNYGIMRVCIVSGATATVPNVFLYYDPLANTWHQDDLGQPMSSMVEIAAVSGNDAILQYGGGQDGFVYKLNTTDDDIATAIDKDIKIELDGEGHIIRLNAMVLVMESQAAGNAIVTVFRNGEAAATVTKTVSMINASADYVRHRITCDKVTGEHLTVRIQNATASQPIYLLKHGYDIERIENNV